MHKPLLFHAETLADAPFPEPSASVGFGTNTIIRDSEHRDETSLPKALDEATTGFFVHAGAKVLVEKAATPRAVFSAADVARFDGDLSRAILLGRMADGSARISVPCKIDEETLEEPFRLYDFRSLLYSSSVSDADAGAMAQGGSLLAWLSAHRFCGRCGNETKIEIGGYRVSCTSCNHKVFPRTDPVVIMLAVKGDKCLMGRSPHFPPGWFSTLAGFVEPGETIEDAVRRETFEESGIRIRAVRYYASQPWPFPHSLMIGVHCEAVSEAISYQADELEDCRWFTRQEVRQMIADEHAQGFKCPPTKAIAHALISAWAHGED